MRYVRWLLLVAVLSVLPSALEAQGRVRSRGYTTKSGTRVQPYTRTRPNTTRRDNWSTRGNRNPITGKAGTKSPYRTRRR